MTLIFFVRHSLSPTSSLMKIEMWSWKRAEKKSMWQMKTNSNIARMSYTIDFISVSKFKSMPCSRDSMILCLWTSLRCLTTRSLSSSSAVYQLSISKTWGSIPSTNLIPKLQRSFNGFGKSWKNSVIARKLNSSNLSQVPAKCQLRVSEDLEGRTASKR